jgi:circadian clock protein KaiC
MVLERISTGITGLDSLIEGGIPRGFTVLIAGNPGTGKTVMTSHFLWEGLKNGENGIYVSFSESKEQFYDNTQRLGMNFKEKEESGNFHFLDFASITKEGIQDALDEVMATIRDTKSKRMVVDSFSAISQSFDNMNEARIALQVVLGKMMRAEGVTNFLIAEVPVGSGSIGSGIEEFVADGIIKLEHGKTNAAPMTVKVVKMRGTAMNREPHVATITNDGMMVYTKQTLRLSYPASEVRLPSGIPGLDDKIGGGGLLQGTVTAMVGASGVGKTTFSFQFLADGVRRGEPSIFVSLEESHDEIARMARHYGHDLKALEEKGLVVISSVAEDQSPDAFITFLKSEIERIKPKRMVIDSLSAFEHTYEAEMYSITKRIVSLMREFNVTCIITILTTQAAGINLTDLGISSLFQNIILLRYVEVEGKMKRSMMLLKMRATDHDESILEFTITDNKGLSIVGAMDNYVGILTGVAHRLQKEFTDKEDAIARQQRMEREKRLAEFEAKERELEEKENSEREKRKSQFEAEVIKVQENENNETGGKAR